MQWIVAVLTVVSVLLFALYRKCLRESCHVTNYALLLLLDENIHAAQRKGLIDLVHAIDAKNATELGLKVNLATTQLASRLSNTMLGTLGKLWALKTGSVPQENP
jgi:hypothetical protein